MNILILISLIALILYIYKISQFRSQWESYDEYIPVSRHIQIEISIIVAFRNESACIESLLTSIEKQAYPDFMYEVILVDDYSDDGSDIIVRHFCERKPNFHYVSNVGNNPGKKSAVRTGISQASHELIVTTDADCVMNEYWLSTMSLFYYDFQADMILGLVYMDSDSSFFGRYQTVEFMSLIASGAGAAAGGKPIYCNAANFAFKKSLFFSLEDPLQEGIISGDDMFFLHGAIKANKKILLLKSMHAVITTPGIKKWHTFVNQRLRWVSKSRHYRNFNTIYTAVLVLVMNLCSLLSLAVLLIEKNIWLFPVIFVLKTTTDYIFLRRFMKYFRKDLGLMGFILFSIIYPFLVTFFAFAGLSGSFTWKGRRY